MPSRKPPNIELVQAIINTALGKTDRKTHNTITKTVLGDELADVQEWMDAPAKELGPHHRVVRHSPIEIIAKYPTDPKRMAAGMIHIGTDIAGTEVKRYVKKKVAEFLLSD